MKKYIVTLTANEREMLGGLTFKGKHRSQKIINALILLGCDEGEFQKKRSTNKEITKVLNLNMKKIDRVKKRFVEDGLGIKGNRGVRSSFFTSVKNEDLTPLFLFLLCFCQE